MSATTPEELLAATKAWWTTDIIDIHPGKISIRGYPVQELLNSLSFVEMIWLTVVGEVPSAGRARLLEAALVASVDHGPHAPSIAISRIATTCGVDLNNAMASAVNVLGDVHGGAVEQCMELYGWIQADPDSATNLAASVDAALKRFADEYGKIISGFGHRFHPVDPRAAPLLELVEDAAAQDVVSGRYAAIGREVEAGIRRRTGKPIPMNIDGATAVIFCELDVPPPLGRGLFVLSRSVGILAHAWEQMQQGGRNKGPMPRQIPYTYAGPAPRLLGREPLFKRRGT